MQQKCVKRPPAASKWHPGLMSSWELVEAPTKTSILDHGIPPENNIQAHSIQTTTIREVSLLLMMRVSTGPGKNSAYQQSIA